MSRKHLTPAFARMLAAVALALLLLLDEAASFSLLPLPGAMLRPQLSCYKPTGRMWPGSGGRADGAALRGNGVNVAAQRSGRTVGVSLGAGPWRTIPERSFDYDRNPSRVGGDASLEESKQRTEEIKHCKTVRDLGDLVAECGWSFSHVNVNAAWQKMAHLPPKREDGGLAAELEKCTWELVGKMGGRQIANTLHAQGRPNQYILNS